MCIICVDFQKGKLTTKEARRALGEMASTLDEKHRADVEKQLADAEARESDPQP
jgi:polyhydroxyalkanoate synthesis regulator phasin